MNNTTHYLQSIFINNSQSETQVKNSTTMHTCKELSSVKTPVRVSSGRAGR